jgi:hypothetical protein
MEQRLSLITSASATSPGSRHCTGPPLAPGWGRGGRAPGDGQTSAV